MKELEVCYGEGDEWKLAPESHGTVACMAGFFVAEGLYLPDPFLQQRGSPKNVPWAPIRSSSSLSCSWDLPLGFTHHQCNIKARLPPVCSPDVLPGDAGGRAAWLRLCSGPCVLIELHHPVTSVIHTCWLPWLLCQSQSSGPVLLGSPQPRLWGVWTDGRCPLPCPA